MNTNHKMKIEIWSDIMCPFCYIGKRNFEAALAKFNDRENLDVEWKSFQLDPTIPYPSDGSSFTEYFSKKKGVTEPQIAKMFEDITQTAKEAGLEYHMDKLVLANTFNAHRLIQKAKAKGLGDAAEESFFKAYFTDGADISDASTLKKIGLETGLTEDEIREALRDQGIAEKVKADIGEAAALGINSVPFFVFNRKYAVAGAQPGEVFLKTIEKAYLEWEEEHSTTAFTVTGGASCDMEGNCN